MKDMQVSNWMKVGMVCGVALFLAGCAENKGPEPPKPGSPAFKWNTAKESYKKGEYIKVSGILVELAEKKGEFTEQARPWAMIMTGGMSNAYMELADKFAEGTKKTRGDAVPFRRYNNEYKGKASAAAMQFIELARGYVASAKAAEAKLAFEIPEASAAEPGQYKKIVTGLMVPAAEIVGVEQEVVRREIANQASLALGSPKDPAKARAAYKDGTATADGQAFLFMTAKQLWNVGEMFGQKKLNQPARFTHAAYDAATQALGLVKGNKDADALLKKIAEADKKLPKE
ncbi:hypothetical protein [Paludibaculum fermentans]|uniref:hypothetical protein n=1 Tax=Paludibaculum fermentans TaxID=1473598 RepID=UPI003EB6C56D